MVGWLERNGWPMTLWTARKNPHRHFPKANTRNKGPWRFQRCLTQKDTAAGPADTGHARRLLEHRRPGNSKRQPYAAALRVTSWLSRNKNKSFRNSTVSCRMFQNGRTKINFVPFYSFEMRNKATRNPHLFNILSDFSFPLQSSARRAHFPQADFRTTLVDHALTIAVQSNPLRCARHVLQ